MNTELLIELEEYGSIITELNDAEINYIRKLKDNPIVLETISKEKQKLRTTKFVGQVVLPSGRVIKVIPKAGDFNIFKLLMHTEGFPQLIFEEITSAKEGESLPDLFAKLFASTINEVIETGLYRKYYRVAEQTNTVRGRILISQTIRSPNLASGKIWCEYDEIGFDVLENQAILCCTNLLLYLVRKPEIKDDLLLIRNTLLSLGVSQATIESYQIDTVNLHRLNEHYDYALKLCKYILEQIWYREFTVNEKLDVITWFHDMNDLFEKLVPSVLVDDLL